MAITVFLSRSPGLLNWSLGAHSAGCWFSLPHLIPNLSDLQLTDFLSSPGLYNNLMPTLLPASVTISHLFNPSTVKVIISWYSSTGCTCYLHRCISYFDSLAGSEVNMQHRLDSSSCFQVLHSLYQSFWDYSKCTNYNWYHCHLPIPHSSYYYYQFWWVFSLIINL